jgi:tRNA A37 threonylcarbamoyladenosine synthetase subunit TsaC/SUA5/YrdC
MPEVPTNITNLSKGVTDLARDAAYVAVGLGVLGYQRVQVERVELQNRLSKDLSLDQRINQIDDLAETATQFVETTLQPLEDILPSSVTQVTTKAREQAREVRTQIRQRVSA